MAYEELEALLNSAPFVLQFGFRLESAEAGQCTLYCPSTDKFLRHDNIISGPVLMAAADTAMWIAIVSSLGPKAAATVTIEMKTNFLAAARRGEDFRCNAKVVKAGSRLIFGTAECVAVDGRILTHHTLTYIAPASIPA